VQVQSGSGSEKREVTLGSMNEVEIAVLSGVQAGDVVLRGTAPEEVPVPTGTVTASTQAPGKEKQR